MPGRATRSTQLTGMYRKTAFQFWTDALRAVPLARGDREVPLGMLVAADLVLENLLCHRVGPFHNWNVHVDDLELVGPEKK